MGLAMAEHIIDEVPNRFKRDGRSSSLLSFSPQHVSPLLLGVFGDGFVELGEERGAEEGAVQWGVAAFHQYRSAS
jgi:hypothetical protein